MSANWDIGFRKKPGLEDLDQFMVSLGFHIEQPNQRRGEFTRVYILDDETVPREIEFFYDENLKEHQKECYGERINEIVAHGDLKTYSVCPTYPNLEDRMRIMKEKGVRTQHDYYRHLSPERLKWYETALALRVRYNAIVLNGQISDEINPDKAFPEKK